MLPQTQDMITQQQNIIEQQQNLLNKSKEIPQNLTNNKTKVIIYNNGRTKKSMVIAYILNIIGMVLGITGLHRIYLGFYFTGMIQLCLSPLFSLIICGTIAAIMIFSVFLSLFSIIPFLLILGNYILVYAWCIIDLFLIPVMV
jgi:TM2 domain-containing membrane protein YozV